MLIEFSVSNFRSFNKKRTLSLEASTGIKDDPIENIIARSPYKMLRSVAIYGANSSGKSNLAEAMSTMNRVVLDSVKLNDKEELNYDPFLLVKDTLLPTYFEILFVIDNISYRYGFEYTKYKIESEWLFLKEGRKKEKYLFIRTAEGIGVNELNFKDAMGLEEKTNDNRLFLSLTAQLGVDVSKTIMEWFKTGYNVISGISSLGYQGFSKVMLHENKKGSKEFVDFLKSMQLGFKSLSITENEFNENMLPNDLSEKIKAKLLKELLGKKKLEIYSIHTKYDKKGNIVGEETFEMERESAGTNKLIDLAGPIFDTLTRGACLFVDELDAKMHPLISEHIIRLFNNPKSNPHGAQLIFTTHDTHLLSSKLLRRDQIWFTEKDEVEQTDLYSLIDMVLPNGQKPRNDSNYERNYIAGRYGGIPFINYNTDSLCQI